MRGVQQLALLEVVADQLQADRHRTFTEARRHAHAGQAGQARRQREDVGEVVGDRVVARRAELPGHARRDRAGDHVAAAKAGREVVGDHAPQLLGLQIVGVVVAMAQHVGPDHDPALDLRAEALAAALLVHVEQVVVARRTVAIAHAVEAAQVRRRLGRGDDVVDRDRQFGARQADVDEGRAESFALGQRGADRALDVVTQAGREELLRQADAQAGERARAGGALALLQHLRMEVLWRPVGAGRIARIETAHRAEQQCAVFRAARERTRLVEARGERDHAVA